jgi:hypothetical protein
VFFFDGDRLVSHNSRYGERLTPVVFLRFGVRSIKCSSTTKVELDLRVRGLTFCFSGVSAELLFSASDETWICDAAAAVFCLASLKGV